MVEGKMTIGNADRVETGNTDTDTAREVERDEGIGQEVVRGIDGMAERTGPGRTERDEKLDVVVVLREESVGIGAGALFVEPRTARNEEDSMTELEEVAALLHGSIDGDTRSGWKL